MKYIYEYLGGPIEVQNPEADVFVVASGCAAAQAREAHRYAQEDGLSVGLIKVRAIRPFPKDEIREAAKNAKALIVPEHNYVGWLCAEVKATIPNGGIVVEGPRVYGGMTLPVELIMKEIYTSLGLEYDLKL